MTLEARVSMLQLSSHFCSKPIRGFHCGRRQITRPPFFTIMHVSPTEFIVPWLSLIVFIKDCNSGLVWRVQNKDSGEINVFNSAEDVHTDDVSLENDTLQSLFAIFSYLDFNTGSSDFLTSDQTDPLFENNNSRRHSVSSISISEENPEHLFSNLYEDLTPSDVSTAQENTANTHYNQRLTNLEETLGSQLLQRENLGHEFFAGESEDISNDMEFDETNRAISWESLQNTEDTLLKWPGSTNIDLSPEQDNSRVRGEDWRITYQHHTGDWSSGYERYLINKMLDQEWFPWSSDMSSENTSEADKMEFACVNNELWEKFSTTVRNRYKDCKFTCDYEGVSEGNSRWKRFIIRIMGCRKGRRRVRRSCRLEWGKSRRNKTHPTV